MVAGCELWDTSEVDAEWEEWEVKCRDSWDSKALELTTQGYERVPDKYFGAVFEKGRKVFYLGRKLASSTWQVIEAGGGRGAVIECVNREGGTEWRRTK